MINGLEEERRGNSSGDSNSGLVYDDVSVDSGNGYIQTYLGSIRGLVIDSGGE